MNEVKDYFNHEIHKGDTLLYNQKASKGYYSSFTEGVVVNIIGNGKIEVCGVDNLDKYKGVDDLDKYENENCGQWALYYTDRKYGRNTVNLTALGIRERIDIV